MDLIVFNQSKIGVGACAALPALLEFRERIADDELEDIDRVALSEYDDPVGWAIQQIRGFPVRGDDTME